VFIKYAINYIKRVTLCRIT